MTAAGTAGRYRDARHSTGPWWSERGSASRKAPLRAGLGPSTHDSSSQLRAIGVQPLAQILAGLEEGHEFLRHRHGSPGAGIAADARRAMLHREGAKAPQLHAAATGHRLTDFTEH